MFKLNRNYFRYGIRLAIASLFTAALVHVCDLPHGYWATFSVIACMLPTSGQSFKRSEQRIVGTFLGMVLGILVAWLCGPHRFYIDLLIPLFVFMTVYLKTFSYSYFAMLNTGLAVLLICLMVPGDWEAAVVRMEMTLLGTFIAICTTYLIFPTKASDDLSVSLNQLQRSLRDYFVAIAIDQTESTFQRQAMQRQAAAKLRLATAAIQDAALETWRFFPKKVHLTNREAQYLRLERVYQGLLLLETVFPTRLTHADLSNLNEALHGVSEKLLDLFAEPDGIDSGINSEAIRATLIGILEEIKTLRIESLKFTDIPVATFNEHIQLMKSIEYLIVLIDILAETSSTETPNQCGRLG